MSSLYDKYFSEINKNYMYDLSCKVIQREYNVDISEENYFKEIYEKNLVDAFNNTNTDDIVVLNRKLLELQVSFYKSMNKKSEGRMNNIVVIKSSDRIIKENDSIYDFEVEGLSGKYKLKTLIISKEENYLFSNPLIIVEINNTNIYLKIKSSYDLNNRTFLEYDVIDDIDLLFDNLTKYTIKSSFGKTLRKNGVLNISGTHEDYIEVIGNNYKEGDCIKINNDIRYIKGTDENKVFLEDIDDLKIDENIINISESPLLIFNSA